MKQQPELEVTEQPTDWLVPYARNAKRHTHEQIDQICASIQEFGFNDPVAVWRNGDGVPEIVEGHGRVLAAKRLGMGQVPVIELNHLSDEQRRAYTHVHNQLTMSTGWEPETLQLDLQELPFDFQELGFDGGAPEEEPVDFGKLRDMTDDSDGDYQEFVDKFKPKSTTDDCFTPEPVYSAVREWACAEYGIEPGSIVRPFYPGGDYERFEYPEGCTVLDNPPFSILAQIIDFYLERGVRFLLFAPFLTLFGCGEKPAEDGTDDAPKTVTITDMIGRQVEIVPGSYQRVVCIGAGALRLYSYVGDVSLLCGVEDIDNTTLEERPKMFDGVARPYVMVYGDTFAALPSCGVGGPNAQAAEAEKILSCTPDIIVSEYEDTDKAEALQQQVGVPVITLRTGVDGVFSEDFSGSITLLGQVFGKETRASELLAFVSTETADIQARTAGIAEDSKPAVYICGLGNWGTTNHLMTIESYSTFTVANIKNTVSGLSAKGVQPIEAEKFTTLGPDMDIMLIDAAAVKNIKPLYAEDNGLFDSCKAWQEGKVYLQMAYNAYYTNYEIALANAWFSAKCVYPEQFTDIDMTEKLNEITGAFLGKGIAEEIYRMPNSFGGYQQIDTATFFA